MGSFDASLTLVVVVIYNTIHALITLVIFVQEDWTGLKGSLTLVDNLSERHFESSELREIC